MKTCVVIYNPNSGRTLRRGRVYRYKSIFEEYNYNVSFIGTEYHGHAKEIVSHLEPVDLVVSMGGDGTFNEVVFGNLSRKKRLVLAHIPVGTTNDVGVMFGYGKDIEKNLKLCLSGKVMDMDIAMINKRPFVYVAGFGKFLNIPYETPRPLKKKYGHLAYIIYALKDLIKPTRNYQLTYKINGKVVTGLYSFVLISSANRIAGVNNFYKDIKLNDDTFEVLFCTYTRRIDIIKALGMLIATDAEHVSGFEFYRTNHLEITFAHHPKKAWCVDGEKLEIRTKTYEVFNERNVKILLPEKNINKLFIPEKKD